MTTLIVSAREFRQNMKKYLDKVDEGVLVIIHRGKNKSYKLVPMEEKKHKDIVMS